MGALWSGSGTDLLHLRLDRLTALEAGYEPSRAALWETTLPLLQAALPPDLAPAVQVCLNYRLLRVGRRIDAVIVTDDGLRPR